MKSKIAIFLWLLSPGAFAQVVIGSGSVISIQPNVTFFSTSDFTNNGTLINNGVLILSGAWTNTGDYQAGSGQITFNGAAAQIINHNAQSISHLLINGSGEKIFRADIYVIDDLSLQQGILSSDNNSKIVMGEQATIIGGSDGSFVQAALYTTGTGEKIYPVGANATYLPLTLTNVSGTSPVVGVQVIEPNPNTKTDPAMKSVSGLRYWQITTSSGTFAGSPVTLPLTGEDASQVLVVAQAAGANDPFHDLGGVASATSVTSNEPTTGGWIAIGAESSRNISVFNAVTPGNNDGKHDFLKIVNIEYYPNNEVTIVNRWGDKVFQITGYNNLDRVFNGDGNVGGIKGLSDGTYYYFIDKRNGDEKISGFFILRR